MKVSVKQGINDHFIGFFDHARRRPGDIFSVPDEPRRELFPGEKRSIDKDPDLKAVYDSIKDRDGKVPQQFSFKWMEPVAASEREKISTSSMAMKDRSDTIKAEKAGQREADKAGGGSGGSKDVI